MKLKDEPPAEKAKKIAISQRRLEANRENARKSTGPRSAQGKANSRFNAETHGLTSKRLLFDADGNPNDKYHLSEALHDEFGRGNVVVDLLIANLVADYWGQDKALEAQISLLSNPKNIRPESSFHGTQGMELLFRYVTANRRAFEKSLALLEKFGRQPAREAADEDESSEIDMAASTGSETSDEVVEPNLPLRVLPFPDSASEDEADAAGCFDPGVRPTSPTASETAQLGWHQAETHIKEDGESSEIDLAPPCVPETSEEVAEPNLPLRILPFPDSASEDEANAAGCFNPGVCPTSPTASETAQLGRHQAEAYIAEIHIKEDREPSEIDLAPSTDRETSEEVADPRLEASTGRRFDLGVCPTSPSNIQAEPPQSHQAGAQIYEEQESREMGDGREAEVKSEGELLTTREALDLPKSPTAPQMAPQPKVAPRLDSLAEFSRVQWERSRLRSAGTQNTSKELPGKPAAHPRMLNESPRDSRSAVLRNKPTAIRK